MRLFCGAPFPDGASRDRSAPARCAADCTAARLADRMGLLLQPFLANCGQAHPHPAPQLLRNPSASGRGKWPAIGFASCADRASARMAMAGAPAALNRACARNDRRSRRWQATSAVAARQAAAPTAACSPRRDLSPKLARPCRHWVGVHWLDRGGADGACAPQCLWLRNREICSYAAREAEGSRR